jgi:hypothetical protein
MSLDADVTNSSFSVDEEAQNEATEASRTWSHGRFHAPFIDSSQVHVTSSSTIPWFILRLRVLDQYRDYSETSSGLACVVGRAVSIGRFFIGRFYRRGHSVIAINIRPQFEDCHRNGIYSAWLVRSDF